MRYEFRPVATCDMCGSTRFKMLGMRLNKSQGLRPRQVGGIAVSVSQCLECGLIFADPQPIPASLSDHYEMPPEDYWSEDHLSRDNTFFSAEIAAAKRLLDFKPGMTALDVGAGLGQAMSALNRAGFDTYGLEPSSPFQQRLDTSRVQLAMVEDAEFPPGTFDFITFGAVLEHLYSPSACLSRALGWLKPNGIVHAEVPSSSWLMSKLVNSYFRLRGTNYVTHLSPMHVPFHLYEFDLRSFEKNGAMIGYDIAEHHYSVCAIPFVPLKPLFRWFMDRTNTGMQLTVFLRGSMTASRLGQHEGPG